MHPWIHIGHAAISTYSLLFLCAYIAGGALTYHEARRRGRATEEMLQVALGALAGGMAALICFNKPRWRWLGYGLLTMACISPVIAFIGCLVAISHTPV
ncbi:MAG TPA: hypothetical protein VHB98_00390 [Chloroflexota bacterium]|jgi:hypothetical protein|nr:hypothetical protein [Chloroflexota bacterium]